MPNIENKIFQAKSVVLAFRRRYLRTTDLTPGASGGLVKCNKILSSVLDRSNREQETTILITFEHLYPLKTTFLDTFNS